jgi:hypothetical protein
VKGKNKSPWRNRLVSGWGVWLLILAVLALGLWPGRVTWASNLSSSQVSGEVRLQGRQDHSDITIQTQGQSGAEGVQSLGVSPSSAPAGTDGVFSVEAQGALIITARRSGYLDAQATVDIASEEPLNLGPTTLYGGEVTGDNVIDISDLSYLGARFHTDDPKGDINGDSEVDILDLSMAAANFSMHGPTPWGE